ncbi:MAG: type II toxin-antitoxin system YafQ family toxin [Prevotella sp.]|nr:type II toxin-antitoxin system YafQ family toxin [Prevotella sp.]
MLKFVTTAKFRKDVKLAEKRGLDRNLLNQVIVTLLDGKSLDRKYKDHILHGEYEGCRECHITNDWLLIYEINEEEAVLVAMRTGTHSDLF